MLSPTIYCMLLSSTVRVRVRFSQGGLSRLAVWHVPGGPVGPPASWAAKSNEVRHIASDKVTKRRRGWKDLNRGGAVGRCLKRKGSIWMFVQGSPSS